MKTKVALIQYNRCPDEAKKYGHREIHRIKATGKYLGIKQPLSSQGATPGRSLSHSLRQVTLGLDLESPEDIKPSVTYLETDTYTLNVFDVIRLHPLLP